MRRTSTKQQIGTPSPPEPRPGWTNHSQELIFPSHGRYWSSYMKHYCTPELRASEPQVSTTQAELLAAVNERKIATGCLIIFQDLRNAAIVLRSSLEPTNDAVSTLGQKDISKAHRNRVSARHLHSVHLRLIIPLENSGRRALMRC
mmetsp:Transcript_22717/g.69428  ORF Transcript_22717/g.69428 Transcript_22717/m.69428 type:complete len:146 (+) Transcript_22717:284-721(+)